LLPEFGRALGAADEIVLTDIYAAGEPPIPGVTVEAVADSVRAASACPVHVVKRIEAVPAAVAALARAGDLVITLGAGSIGSVADRILEQLRGTSAGRADPSADARGGSKPAGADGEGGGAGE
jgi:UDP-N-acetylmuramate--alanine ligase